MRLRALIHWRLLLASTGLILLTVGCGGGSGGLMLPHSTPTPTPQPRPLPLVGSYSGTYSATFDPHSPLSGTRTGTLEFTVARDGKLTVTAPQVYFSGYQPPPPLGRGTCDLRTGDVMWDQPLYLGSSLNFSGQLRLGVNGAVTGSGKLYYREQMEVASGPWQAQRR